MENEIKYNRTELEENLPDYLLAKLSDEEKIKFESSVKDYPDLIQLSGKVNKIYSEMRNENLIEKSEIHNIDISASVLFQLRKKDSNKKAKVLRSGFYYAIPLAAAVLIAYLLIPFNFSNNQNIKLDQNSGKPIVTFQENELKELENEDVLLAAYEGYSYRNKSVNEVDNTLLDELSSEHYSKIFDESSYKSLESEIIPTFNYDKSENSYLDLTNDNELTSILKEIENVNFKS